ncbi:hypothetical protein BJ138DRAFT_1204115 [Hygrophoropsis aurantiaca]|uniref:Uncharacterized protein n=1 Tax=Hygrophoropsis aurantiaca TaxID=72124 RepID=A0ACB8A635_9AGAM|nr:hypothetical protein BJ138DRAFT_1204115 [Hygrophoropsis aurantiaca]
MQTAVTQPIKQFLYKSIHGAFKIGDFWNGIPNYEHRSKCSACTEDTESMEHIMVECTKSHQNLLWTLAKELWPNSEQEWPTISIGTILGCGAQENTNKGPDAKTAGRSRLLRILISETAHLIWTTRCSQAINGTEFTPKTIAKRWHNAIEKRLAIDRTHMKNKKLIKPKDIKKILHTWTGTLYNENSLPYDWAERHEVLVGIKPPRSSAYRGHQAAHESHTPRTP